jgi:hypothetical protein
LKDAARRQLRYRLFVVATPFGRRQVRPADATGGQIFTAVLHRVEKCVVGAGNGPLEIPHDNAHDIGVDQTPDFRLQPSRQFTDLCFRLFALGHLDSEVLYVFQRLICRRRKFA